MIRFWRSLGMLWSANLPLTITAESTGSVGVTHVQLPSKYLKKEWKSILLLVGPGMTSMWIATSLLVLWSANLPLTITAESTGSVGVTHAPMARACRKLGVQLVLAGVQLPSKYLKKEWKSILLLVGPGMTSMWIDKILEVFGDVVVRKLALDDNGGEHGICGCYTCAVPVSNFPANISRKNGSQSCYSSARA
jgi:hypothetical protein